MTQNKLDINALGQVIDNSWGRSSTSTAASSSVKVRVHGSMLMVTFGVMTNANGKYGLVQVKTNCKDEAEASIKATLDRIKSEYKTLTGNSIKLREMDSEDSLEVIQSSSTTSVKTVLYRMTALVEIM